MYLTATMSTTRPLTDPRVAVNGSGGVDVHLPDLFLSLTHGEARVLGQALLEAAKDAAYRAAVVGE